MSAPIDPAAETLWLQLHAEQVAVAKRAKPVEIVRVTARTQTRDVAVDEPLTHETVVVERVPVGRYVESVPDIRVEGDVTIMPVVEEEVVITRRLLLREEVHLRRARVVTRHVETVQLREQTATVSRILPEPLPSAVLGTAIGREGPANLFRSLPMNDETIVAVYDTPAAADAAVADLRAANVPEAAISRHSGTSEMGASSTASTSLASPGEEKGFWSSLFGDADHHTDSTVYDRSVQGGSSVVVVKTAPDHDVDAVVTILERHSPIDIDERAEGYGLTSGSTAATSGMASGMTAPVSAATTAPVMNTAARTSAEDGGMIQLSEEQLAVGKRVVNRGGTRIRRYVVETPVEENVTLHAERVTLERHPVTDGRPVTDGSFSEKTIEMTETAEEAVVSKTARVVEEIGLRKEATDRVETIRDTVRKEEVEIEQLPAGTTAAPVTPTKI